MESCNLVHDGDSIISALKALVELGCDGGLGNGRIWFLLDNGLKRVRESCPDDNTIAEQIGTTQRKCSQPLEESGRRSSNLVNW